MDNLFIWRAAGGEKPGGRQFQNSADVVGDMRRALEAEEAAGELMADGVPAPEKSAQGPFASGKDTFFGKGVFPRLAQAGEDGTRPSDERDA